MPSVFNADANYFYSEVFYFLANHLAMGISRGAERQMEEKVPATTPTSITSAKLRVASALGLEVAIMSGASLDAFSHYLDDKPSVGTVIS